MGRPKGIPKGVDETLLRSFSIQKNLFETQKILNCPLWCQWQKSPHTTHISGSHFSTNPFCLFPVTWCDATTWDGYFFLKKLLKIIYSENTIFKNQLSIWQTGPSKFELSYSKIYHGRVQFASKPMWVIF